MIRITIGRDSCKGCGLCVVVCPYSLIELGEEINAKGYHPAVIDKPEDCIGCGSCAKMCPDLAIEIIKEEG